MRDVMRRFERDYYPPTLLTQHENKMQELRHERKSERQRLDGLKKVLQTKLSVSSAGASQSRAA